MSTTASSSFGRSEESRRGAAYIVRVGGDRASEEALPPAPEPAAILGTYRVVARALPEGTPEDLTVEVADPPEGAGDDRFNLVVKRGGQVVETFESVTTKRGKENVVAARSR